MRRAGLLPALLLTCLAAACASHADEVVIHTKDGPRTVAVEIVATDAARQRGLMYRRELPEGTGMLFVFDEESDHAFWMKNTFIPLDMIFVGGDRRIVGVQANTVPHSLRQLSVGKPSRWVVEVPAGWSARNQVKEGDRVSLPKEG